jgi:hypothetical protein
VESVPLQYQGLGFCDIPDFDNLNENNKLERAAVNGSIIFPLRHVLTVVPT